MDLILQDNEYELVHDSSRDLCEDITPQELPDDLDQLEKQIERLKQRWGEFTYLIGQRLKHILELKLYEQNNYPNFKTYVTVALKMAENNAYYYIAVYNYFTEEQTRLAGSKLKLIIPFLNKIRSDKTLPEPVRDVKLKALRDELYFKIYKKSYREAEKIIKQVKSTYFSTITDLAVNDKKIEIKKDRIIIHEEDETVREKLIALINDFYN